MRGHPLVERHDVDVAEWLRLHVALSGTGPPLLLLHGFTGSTETWASLRAPLGAAHRTIAVDLPGHGGSTAPREPARYALGRLSDDLARVLDTLAVERVALLGYSMGGRAAMRFALHHPDRVAALVLESASPGIADPVRRAERVVADAELADSIERDGVRAFVERWERLPLWESQRALSDAARALLRRQREENQPVGLANSLRGAGVGADDSVLDRLGTLHAPTLLLAGALDAPYVAFARLMEQALSHARVAIVPDAGHAVHLERPEAYVAEVLAFLGNVLSRVGTWD